MRRRVYRRIYVGRILFAIALISVLVCGAILYAVYAESSGSLRLDAQNYYAVAVSKKDSYAAAQAELVSLRQSGGAGYVFTAVDGFYVAASAYQSLRDAETVAARIDGASVYPVLVAQARFAFSQDRSLATEYAAYFRYPYELFSTVFHLAVQLQEGSVTESYALLAMQGLCERVYDKKEELQVEYSAYPHVESLVQLYATLFALCTDAANYKHSSYLIPNFQYLLCAIADSDAATRNAVLQNIR